MKRELIVETLNDMFPNAKAELEYSNNFELLIAVVLSAQTTDVGVNKVTPALFKKYPTPYELSKGLKEEVEYLIKSIGLYKNKAKNIINLSKILVESYNGEVPSNRKDLESLPGVGRKTANVVLSNAFNQNFIAVDTHVSRVAKRLGIDNNNDSLLVIEQKIEAFFNKDDLHKLHHQLIFFGRYHCTARNPKCEICKLQSVCSFFQEK